VLALADGPVRRQFGEVKIANPHFFQAPHQAPVIGKGITSAAHAAARPHITKGIDLAFAQCGEKAVLTEPINAKCHQGDRHDWNHLLT